MYQTLPGPDPTPVSLQGIRFTTLLMMEILSHCLPGFPTIAFDIVRWGCLHGTMDCTMPNCPFFSFFDWHGP